MGLFETMWMWEAAERADRAQFMARAASRRARFQALSTDKRIEALEGELDEMRLVLRALSEVLRAKGSVDETLFREALDRIDLEDGVRDGKAGPPAPPPPPPFVAPHRTRPRT